MFESKSTNFQNPALQGRRNFHRSSCRRRFMRQQDTPPHHLQHQRSAKFLRNEMSSHVQGRLLHTLPVPEASIPHNDVLVRVVLWLHQMLSSLLCKLLKFASIGCCSSVIIGIQQRIFMFRSEGSVHTFRPTHSVSAVPHPRFSERFSDM